MGKVKIVYKYAEKWLLTQFSRGLGPNELATICPDDSSDSTTLGLSANCETHKINDTNLKPEFERRFLPMV